MGLLLLVTGAAVMIIEILGTKVIGPFFGVSHYVWSSLITVTLLSLSAGYYVGGFWADRRPDARVLHGIVFASGLLVAGIPLAALPVIHSVESFDLRAGTFFSAFILFSAPLGILGMVTPFAVRIESSRLDKVGMTAGILYAVSTLGSLGGTILAGFVLIPELPVRMIFFLVAGSLMGVALLGLLISGGVRRRVFLTLFLLAVGSLVLCHRSSAASAGDARLLYRSDSYYGQIKVVDFEGSRTLLVNGSPQNFVSRSASLTLLEETPYAVYLTAALGYRPQIKKVLMIGLGGGTLPMIFKRFGVTTDVIEIDSRMVEVAKRFFGYEPGDGKILLGDGRFVLKRLDEKYDALVLDAFASYDQPFHLFTREMFEEVKNHLREGGIFGINSAGFVNGEAARFSKAIFRTLKEVFPHVEAFHIEGEHRVGNVIFFASAAPLGFSPGSSPLGYENLSALIGLLNANRASGRLQGGIVLTDEYNPIPYWGIPIYKAWREEVVRYFGRKILESF